MEKVVQIHTHMGNLVILYDDGSVYEREDGQWREVVLPTARPVYDYIPVVPPAIYPGLGVVAMYGCPPVSPVSPGVSFEWTSGTELSKNTSDTSTMRDWTHPDDFGGSDF
jgi:hypothetical protein